MVWRQNSFVLRDFYVDDGLASFPTSDLAIHVLKQTKEMLAVSNIRLHKIASNHKAVMEAFPPEERAKELKGLALGLQNSATLYHVWSFVQLYSR